jgi:hypothetical protein
LNKKYPHLFIIIYVNESEDNVISVDTLISLIRQSIVTHQNNQAINLISPEGITSKNAAGMATSGYLVEVEKVSMTEMEDWRKKYLEAFAREYEPASGLRFNAWVI